MKREKREAKANKKRAVNTRSMIVRFLIVCEGACTEPYYFKALVRDKNNRFSEIKEEDIRGEGYQTRTLVERTLAIKAELEKNRQLLFDRVWVVFDEDGKNDFNEAIVLARKYGFCCAWTNEAFELWYLLHFVYLDTAITRHDYIKKLEEQIRLRSKDKSYRYEKNDPQMYRLLQELGDQSLAKRYAENLRANFEGDNFKLHKPCTMVDKLVDEIEHPERLPI